MPQAPRVIRKYANRRLYDATASRHVTLEDIRRLIAGGERVQVLDDRSGEDLTRAVLLQIISEQEQFGAPVLSVQVLEGIIRFYGNPVQELLSRGLRWKQCGEQLLSLRRIKSSRVSSVSGNFFQSRREMPPESGLKIKEPGVPAEFPCRLQTFGKTAPQRL